MLYAQVMEDCPAACNDTTSMWLRSGEIIRVNRIHLNGKWEGEVITRSGLSIRRGWFYVTHVQVIQDPFVRQQYLYVEE